MPCTEGWAFPDEPSVEAALGQAVLDLELQSPRDVVFYIGDTSCGDNSGTIQAELSPL
jgi:hypothetical protein